jgi:hypothetical protein
VHKLRHQASKVKPFKQVRTEVEKAYRKFHINQLVLEHAKRLASLWREDGSHIGALVKHITFDPLNQRIKPFDTETVDAVYQMDFSDHRVLMHPRPQGGYWVMHLDTIEDGSPVSHEQRKVFKKRLQALMNESDFYLLRSALLAKKPYRIEDRALLEKVLGSTQPGDMAL